MEVVECKKAEILDDGNIVRMTFVDRETGENLSFQLQATEWVSIIRYKAAYEALSKLSSTMRFLEIGAA